MQRLFTTTALAGTLAAGLTGTALSQSDTDIAQMRADLAQMQAELSRLKAQQQGDWLTEARADEVRSLINEVLADANTRATLLQENERAGIDAKGKIFLNSADGDFSMNIGGQVQFRYIHNYQKDRGDESLSGFQMRRTKLKFTGQVAESWEYNLVLQADRDSGTVSFEDASLALAATDKLKIHFGIMKLPFARQELISDAHLVAVDRGLATEFFDLKRSEGVNFAYQHDAIRAWFMLSDGTNNSYSDFNTTGGSAAHDFAITGRVDVMAIGEDWGNSNNAFGGVDETHLFLGAAVNYGQGEFGAAAFDNQLNWTVDGLLKAGHFGVMAGVFGSSTKANPGGTDSDALGFFGQVDYKIAETKWDIFARYDYIDDDTADQLSAVTIGANYHFNKNVKVTGDVLYIIDSDNPDALGFLYDGEDSDGLGVDGLTDNSGEDMIILRLQLQLLF